MCGIVAFLQNSAVPLAAARDALASLEHRGPDASGEWQEGDVYLGHRRLSIIDLRTGAQPMHSADGRYVIVFNGEIYNYRELRRDLQADGAVFRTASDTEVILEGYRRWGADVVVRLNGMFAFVIWDRVEQTAFGARDRLGIKPLCWALKGETFIVASTLGAVPRSGRLRRIRCGPVRDLMTFDYIPAPRTFRRGVRKLPPGSRFGWRRGSREPRIDTYWTPPPADRTMTPPTEEELEDLLSRVVKRQMVSDVPLGVFLSGGIDSSLLVALMARHSTQAVKTYSVSFAEQEVDESPIAAAVARHFATDHEVLRSEDVGPESLQHLVGALDEPFCYSALVPLFALSRLTRAHVKVALSGDWRRRSVRRLREIPVWARLGTALPFASLMRRSINSMRWRPRGMAHLYAHTMSPSQRLRYAFSRRTATFRCSVRICASSSLDVSFMTHGRRPEHFFEPWERVARKVTAPP